MGDRRSPRQLTHDEVQQIGAAARLRVLEEAQLLGDPLAVRSNAIDEITDLVTRELGGVGARASVVTPSDARYLGATNPVPGVDSENVTDHEHSYCRYVVADAQPLVVEDTVTHPMTAGSAPIEDMDARSYAGVPIVTPEGHVLGALCVLDSKPHAWSDRDLDLLRHLAKWVVMEVELRRQVTRLEESARERDALLSTIMHELHNPLMAVVGSARMLHDSFDDLPAVDRRRLLLLIRRHGERVHRMVCDLHVMAQVDAGRLPIRIEDIPLGDVVDVALEDSGAAGLMEQVDVPDVVVRGDRDRIEQVLVNLLTNARKYGRAPIALAGTELPDRIELRVRDSGVGVPPSFEPLLFDRFARAPDTAGALPGTGLGLAISRAFAREMGGDVRYEPVPGGACFVLELPIASSRAC